MSYLLYCVFRSAAPRIPGVPAGVGGRPVAVVAQNGLSAGLSELAEADRVPDTAGILVYERVIATLFNQFTVIPMRYGCYLENLSEARHLLERHRAKYAALLDQLEGLGEMAIHVLLDSSGGGTESEARPAAAKSLPLLSQSGSAYLAARQQRYLGQDRAALPQRRLAEELCGPLAGLFARRKVEFSHASRCRLVSLYFLVPRASLETFLRAARHLHPKESVKLLLSGPWPPYNFVDFLSA